MTGLQKTCANHPDREAIARCIITGKPICAECSTRYEGVNYSREGLAILQEQRRAAAAGKPRRFAAVLVWASVPVLGLLMYLFYVVSFMSVIDAVQAAR